MGFVLVHKDADDVMHVPVNGFSSIGYSTNTGSIAPRNVTTFQCIARFNCKISFVLKKTKLFSLFSTQVLH